MLEEDKDTGLSQVVPKNPVAEVVGLEVEANLVTWKRTWSCLKQRGVQWIWGRLPEEAKAAGLWTTLQVNESRSVVSDSFRPHGLESPWDSPGQNTGVGSLSCLQPSQSRDQTQISCIADGFFTT